MVKPIPFISIILCLFMFCDAEAAIFNVSSVSEFESALDASMNNGQNDTINIAAGTYMISSKLEYLPPGSEDYSLTIQGAEAGTTILDGGGGTSILAISCGGLNTHVTIRGITFQNGNEASQAGGALYVGNSSAQTTIEDSVFQNNMAFSGGAAVYLFASSGGSATVAKNTFAANSSIGDYSSGAFYAYVVTGTITLTGNTFSSNSSLGYGAGLHAITNTGTIALTGNTFSSNVAVSYGGGAYISNQSTGSITVSDNTFSGNSAGSAAGARIDNQYGTATIIRNVFRNNIASTSSQSDGGGLFGYSQGTYNVIDNLFIGNTASQRGAGASLGTIRGEGHITNNTFAGNTSTGTYYEYGSLGGGIYLGTSANDATVNIYNNIFWGNTAAAPGSNGADLYIYDDGWADGIGSIVNLFNNVYSDMTIWRGDHLTQGGNISEDPRLEPDYRIKAGSPCIDAGSNSAPELPTTDLGGDPRVQDGHSSGTATVDIGAYEFHAPGPYADLAVSVSHQPEPALVGHQLTYMITILNKGANTAENAVLTNTLPPGVSFVSAHTSRGSCGASGSVVTCTVGSMANGTDLNVEVVAIAPASGGLLANTAAVTSATYDPDHSNDSAVEQTTVKTKYDTDVSVMLADHPALVVNGNPLTYTATVTNNGPDPASDVVLTDSLPVGMTFVSASSTLGTCTHTTGTVICHMGGMAAATSATVTIDGYAPNTGGLISNTAVVDSTVNDGNTENNTAILNTTVLLWNSDVSVILSHYPDPVYTGLPLFYTATITNTGPDTATGVVLLDTLPSEVTLTSVSSSAGNCGHTSNVVTCSIGNLQSGALVTVSMIVEAPTTAGNISNSASVSLLNDDPNSLNNTDHETTTIGAMISTPGTIDLPSTGQATCYSANGSDAPCTDTGQDGEFRAGITWPGLRFMDNGDGTMTDKLTGLIWLLDANCMATHAPTRDVYGTAGDGLVPWDQALSFVKVLNQGYFPACNLGYHDWRLPNINELESLVNAGVQTSRLWLQSQGVQNVQYSYWSSTTYNHSFSGHAYPAFWMALEYGSLDYVQKYLGSGIDLAVWPVRGLSSGPAPVTRTGQTACYEMDYAVPCTGTGQDGEYQAGVEWPSPRLIAVGNGTVTDQLTGLVWLKDANCIKSTYASFDADGKVTWQQALNFVAGINEGTYQNCGAGYSDWRLPNRKEFYSLIDHQQGDADNLPAGHPFINVPPFSNYPVYWTSTSGAWAHGNAYAVFLGLGGGVTEGTQNGKQDAFLVWPVRGGSLHKDSDGVPDNEEMGPGGDDSAYDGNGDGIPDGQQANVASLHTFDGNNYVTLASGIGTELSNAVAVDNPSPGDSPATVAFPFSFFEFAIRNAGAGGSGIVTIYLPAGANPVTYWKFGPTPDNPDTHWYEFLYDGQTGAVIAGNVITLHFVDGLRGDDDIQANGVIFDVGAPGSAPPRGAIYLHSPLREPAIDMCSLVIGGLPVFTWMTGDTFTKYSILFSTDPAFSRTVAKLSVKGTKSDYTPSTAIWKKVMTASATSGREVYWKVIGTKSGKGQIPVESDAGYVGARPAEAAIFTGATPADGAVLPGDVSPIFEFETNCNTTFTLEFSAVADFSNRKGIKAFKITVNNPVIQSTVQKSLGAAWKSVVKMMGNQTGYYRVKTLDALKREEISEVRSFTILYPASTLSESTKIDHRESDFLG
jgi:uncharacterized repeat protein (TIGR01451 family)